MRYLLVLAMLVPPLAAPGLALEPADSTNSAARFDTIAARYHTLLGQRPQRGTAFDLLYRHYLDAGRLDALVAYYDDRAKREPSQPADHLLLGMVHARCGHSAEALAALRRAAELARDDFRPHYYEGLLLSRLHRYPEAITALQTALTNKPTRTELLGIYKKLGQLQRRIGQTDAALKTWSTLAEQFPSDPFVVEELAELLADEEQFDEAIRRYRQLVTLCKEDTYRPLMAQVEIGQIQVRQGKLKTAVATFESCLAHVNPDSWLAKDIRRKIENIFLRRNDLSGLTDYYRARLQQRPNDLDVMVRLAATTSRLGNSAAAIEQYRAAVKLAPSRNDLREQLIAELERANRWADARSELEALVAKHPRDINYLQRLGQLYLQETAGTADRTVAETRALDIWHRCAAVRPADPLLAVQAAELCCQAAGIGTHVTVTGKGTTFTDAGKTRLGRAALAFYQDAVRRRPDVSQYHEYLGEYLHAIGQADQALAAWRQIAAPPRDTAENLRRLAEVLEMAGQVDAAVATVEQALKKAPNRYELHAMAADLRVRREEYDRALEHIVAMQRLAATPYLLEQTLTRQVAVHAAAGRLPEEAAKLAARLNAADAEFTDFWLAAMMASAERRWTTALAYLQQALQRKPDDTRLLRFLAKLYRQGGDLAGAARQYRRLADLERSSRSNHLRELVQIELELGRREAARQAAEELVQLAPGNVENVQLLAAVLFRDGQIRAALDTLRQAVQSDPRNRDVRIALAYQLAKHERVDEALEHYWQAFQLADTLEDKLSVVGALADLHVIAGRCDQLIDRLKQLRRVQEDPLGITLCLAKAHIQAEDFANARRELSGLLAERPDDVHVLGQLVSLSERLEDAQQAAVYQERVVELVPEPVQLQRLANLYDKLGESEKSQAIWVRLARQAKDATTLLAASDRAAQNQQYELVVALAGPEWARHTDDWRFGVRLAQALWHLKQYDQVQVICQSLLKLVPNDKYAQQSLPASTGAQAAQQRAGYRSSYPPLLMRLQWAMQFHALIDNPNRQPRRGSSNNPRTLADAQMISAILLDVTAQAQGRRGPWRSELRRRSEHDTNALRQLAWVLLAETQRGPNDELHRVLEQWIERSPDEPDPRLLQFVLPLWSPGPIVTADDRQATLAKMKQQYAWFKEHEPNVCTFLANSYLAGLLRSGARDEARELASDAIDHAQHPAAISELSGTIARLGDGKLVAKLLARLSVLQQQSAGTSQTPVSTASILRQLLPVTTRNADSEQVLTLFDQYLTATHPRSVAASAALVSLGKSTAYQTTRSVSSRPIVTTKFPRPTAYLDASRLQLLETTYRALKATGKRDVLVKLVEQRIDQSTGTVEQCWQLAQVFLCWWEGDRLEAITALGTLADDAPDNVAFRILQAHALAATGDVPGALAAIDGVHIPFGPQAKIVEQLRMDLAMRTSNDAVAKRAALRLFGMRLASHEQLALAQVMRRLGLTTRSEELLDRTARSAGGRPSDLYQVMRATATDDPERAARIARQLLRQSPRTTSPRPATDQYRSEALRFLRRAGALEKIIEATEGQLAAAPQSVRLLEDLVEYYTAAGRDKQALAILRRMSKVRPDDPDLCYRVAQSLLQQGEHAEGIELLGTVWEKDPRIVLQQSQNTGRYYAEAGRLDRLADHLAHLKNHPLASANAYQLTHFVTNLRDADVDAVIKVYHAIIEIVSAEQRSHVIGQFGRYLVQNNRKNVAYDLYRQAMFPESLKPASEQVPAGPHQLYRFSMPPLTELANLARDLDRLARLEEQAEAFAASHPAWRPQGELLIAMLKRRSGDEGPLQRLGQRQLDDAEFAANMHLLYSVLRAELRVCKTQAALLTAVDLFEREQQQTVDSASLAGNPTEAIRGAELYVKVGQRDKARQILLAAASAPPADGSGRNLLDGMIQRNLQIADALRTHGFQLDAIRVYDRTVRVDIRQLPESSYTRRHLLPQAYSRLRVCVDNMRGQDADQAITALGKELSKQKDLDLAAYFVVVELPVTGRGDRYRDPFAAPQAARRTEARTIEPPLLLELLTRAKERGQLDALAETAGRQHERDPENLQVAALDVLLSVTRGDWPTAATALTGWTDRVADKPDVAALPETWLLASTALTHDATRPVGQRLALAVEKAAAERGDTARQQAAVLAVLASATDSAMADQLIGKIRAGRETDPQLCFLAAQAYFQRKEYAEGVALLGPVWQSAPELLLPDLVQFTQYYVEAGQVDQLAAGLRAVQDARQRSRSLQVVEQAFYRVVNDKKTKFDDVMTLYRAGVEFGANGTRRLSARMGPAMKSLPRNRQTVAYYEQIVLPTPHSSGQLDPLTTDMIDLAKSLGQLDPLETACRRAITQYPKWKPQGELLVAMIHQRRGDSAPLLAIGKKACAERSTGGLTPADARVLRQELEACGSQQALDIALQLWQQLAAQETDNNTYAVAGTARLLVQMDQRDKARALLRETLERPLRSSSSRQLEMRMQAQARHRATVANLLAKNGFRLDALRVQQSITALDTSRLSADSYTRTTIRTAAERGQRLVKEILRDEADQVLQRLLSTLQQTEQPPDLTVFFTQFDATATPPRPGGRGPATPPTPVALLTGLLQHARQTQLSEQLAAAAAAARLRFPNHLPLQALDAVISLQSGQPDRALPILESVVHAAQRTPATASQPAIWSLAQAALADAMTRKQGQQLAAAVAAAAAKAGNANRQAAALVALALSRSASGQADDAAALLDRAHANGNLPPESRYQLALRFAQQKVYADAIRILAVLWREKPDLLMSKLTELAPVYADADRIDALIESLGQVQDKQLWQRYHSSVVNAAQRIGQQKDHLDDAVKLLQGAAALPQIDTKRYIWSSLGSLLLRDKRQEEAWDAYRQAVFPPTGRANSLSSDADRLISLSQQLDKFAALETESQKAVTHYPDWAASRDLLLAMVQQRQGNETPLTDLAKKYRDDSDYAESLIRSRSVLRTELAKCQSRPPLELARDLWLEEVEGRRDHTRRFYDTAIFDSLARVYLKLGQRDKAREILLASLDLESRTLSASSSAYNTFQQRRRLAKLLSSHGFYIDTIRLYQQLLAMDLYEASSRSSIKRQQGEVRGELRAAVQQVVAHGLADALVALERELRQGTPPDLAPFFVLLPAPQGFGPPRPPRPSSAAAERTAQVPRPFLPALLALAHDQGSIDRLAKSVAEAHRRFPASEMLATLNALLRIERGESVAAEPCVDRWTELAARNLTPVQFGQALLLAMASARDADLQASGERLAKALLTCASQDDALLCYVAPLLSDPPNHSWRFRGEWHQPPPDPAWVELDPALVAKLQDAHGLVADRFALCQTMPLKTFVTALPDMSRAGYRPTRCRPYTVDRGIHVAAIWLRDGRDGPVVCGLREPDLRQRDTNWREQGYVMVDLAGYVAEGGGEERYAAVWAKPSEPRPEYAYYVGVTDGPAHEAAWSAIQSKGYRARTHQIMLGHTGQLLNTMIWWKRPNAPSYWQFRYGDRSYYLRYVQTNHLQLDVTTCSPADSATSRDHSEDQLQVAEDKVAEERLDASAQDRAAKRPSADANEAPSAPSQAARQGNRYGGVWEGSNEFVSRELHGLTPAEQLDAIRHLPRLGFRPAAIAVAPGPAGQPEVTASVWHRPARVVLVEDRKKE